MRLFVLKSLVNRSNSSFKRGYSGTIYPTLTDTFLLEHHLNLSSNACSGGAGLLEMDACERFAKLVLDRTAPAVPKFIGGLKG